MKSEINNFMKQNKTTNTDKTRHRQLNTKRKKIFKAIELQLKKWLLKMIISPNSGGNFQLRSCTLSRFCGTEHRCYRGR